MYLFNVNTYYPLENWHFGVQRMVGQGLMCPLLSRLNQYGSALEPHSMAQEIHGWITRTSRVQRRHLDLHRRQTSGISHRQRGALGRRTISGVVRTLALTRDRRPATQLSLQKMAWMMAQPSLIHSTLWRWTTASGTQTAPVDHLACRAGRSVQPDQEVTTSGQQFNCSIQDHLRSPTLLCLFYVC